MPLVHGRKNPHSPVHLYLSSSSTLDLLAAVAARVPSSKGQSSSISTLRISFRLGRGVQPHPKLLIINYSLLIKKASQSARLFSNQIRFGVVSFFSLLPFLRVRYIEAKIALPASATIIASTIATICTVVSPFIFKCSLSI